MERISFPKKTCPLSVSVVNSRKEAFIVDRTELESLDKLQLCDQCNALKLISFVTNTSTIVIICESDILEVQTPSSPPRKRYPIRERDRSIKNAGQCLVGDLDGDPSDVIKNYGRGLINSMSFSSDGRYMCLTTLDQYILIHNTTTFAILKMVHVKDNTLKDSCFLKSCDLLIIGLTFRGAVILVDVNEARVKGIIHSCNAYKINVTPDGKMLFVILNSGEINVYLTETILNYLQQMEESKQNMMEDVKDGRVRGRSIDPNVSIV